MPEDAAVVEGALLAPRLGLAFTMRPGGGIAAFDLASGRLRWQSQAAARPLALVGDRLLAQAESGGRGGDLELVLLDVRRGTARGSARVRLPAGVTASVVDTPAGSFRVRAVAAGGEVAVRWEHASLSGGDAAQGYLPAADERQAPSVDGGEAVLSVVGAALRLEGATTLRPATAAALSGAGLRELTEPAVTGARGRQFLSLDGRHVLVSERVEAAEFTLEQHRWTIHERASGARLGAVPALVAASPFVVVGQTLYFTAPPHVVRRDDRLVRQRATLRAVNLQTGAEVWAQAVRESAFRGPFPP